MKLKEEISYWKQKKEYRPWMVAAALAVACLVLVWLLARSCSKDELSIEHQTEIEMTPEQIRSIRDIGQWEFLAVSDEEFVDTVRRTFMRTDRLARIYYGTMRIGVDMARLDEDWIEVRNDTVSLTLPPVGLLDERFIDEARTVSFHESGSWKAQDREAMYQRAKQRMLHYGLSPQNLKTAEANADAQFRQLLHAMGFENVEVRFRERD
ncbi:MAG: DUF4230 domain-containing protein [Prevotella sp.]|nr:DUF4230 domain-containing protein [Prevotella sp.]